MPQKPNRTPHWGFSKVHKKPNRDQYDSSGKNEAMFTPHYGNTWGFDYLMESSYQRERSCPTEADWWLYRHGDDGENALKLEYHYETEDSDQSTISGLRSIKDLFNGLPHSTRDLLTGIGIAQVLNFNARTRPLEGDTLFHILANPRFHTREHRRGTWDDRLQITRQVVNILVESGMDIDASAGRDPVTPLMAAVNTPMSCRYPSITHEPESDGLETDSDGALSMEVFADPRWIWEWGEGETIMALLDAGADPTVSFWPYEPPILYTWLRYGLEATRSPENFDQVLLEILTRLPNINARDYDHGTIIHYLAIAEDDPKYVRHLLQRASEVQLPRPLNVDALDTNGRTPLLALCISRAGNKLQDNALDIARALVNAGAQLDFVSSTGDSPMSAIINRRDDCGDKNLAHNIEQVILLGPLSPSGHSALVDSITPSFLAYALYRGHTMTAAVLLKYGMKNQLSTGGAFENPPSWFINDLFTRTNEDRNCGRVINHLTAAQLPSESRSPVPGSIADLAFCGLGRTRLFMWNYSFILCYPMFPLAGRIDATHTRNHWGRWPSDEDRSEGIMVPTSLHISSPRSESEAEMDTSESDDTDRLDYVSLSDETSKTRQRRREDAMIMMSTRRRTAKGHRNRQIEDLYCRWRHEDMKITQTQTVNGLFRTRDRARYIPRSGGTLRRAESCPVTKAERQQYRDRGKPRAEYEYYLYTKSELQTRRWRRDSLPTLDSTVAIGTPLVNLQRGIFDYRGGNSSFDGALREKETTSIAERWVLGQPKVDEDFRVIPWRLDYELGVLETWEWVDRVELDRDIERARQAINSTADGHPYGATWLMSFATKLAERFKWKGNIADLDEAIDAGRQAVKAIPEDHPWRARWTRRQAVNLGLRCKHMYDAEMLDEAIDLARLVLDAALKDASPGKSDKTQGQAARAVLTHMRYLTTLLRRRAKHPGPSTASDLTEAINIGRQITTPRAPAVGADPADLKRLSYDLLRRYTYTRNIVELHEALDIAEGAYYRRVNRISAALRLLPVVVEKQEQWFRYDTGFPHLQSKD
ncbi:hypothetical protein BJX99DRAFT_264367 [Aspergillus californicus]